MEAEPAHRLPCAGWGPGKAQESKGRRTWGPGVRGQEKTEVSAQQRETHLSCAFLSYSEPKCVCVGGCSPLTQVRGPASLGPPTQMRPHRPPEVTRGLASGHLLANSMSSDLAITYSLCRHRYCLYACDCLVAFILPSRVLERMRR